MGNILENMAQDLRDQWEWVILQWEWLARREASFLVWVQSHRDTWPVLRPLKRVLSWHPMKDITLIVWISFLVSLPWIGYKLCFEFMAIAIVSFAVNWATGVRCPGDLDHRLKQLSRISPYGCPSMEITMAAVISTSMAEAYGEPWAWSVGYGAVLFLCFTRIYAGAYLPHQLVISWAWGAGGIILVRYITMRIWKKRVPDHWKLANAVIMFGLILGWVAYRAESNRSPFMRIPKSEYTRVLSHIMNQDADTNMDVADDDALPAEATAGARNGIDSDAEYRGARRRRNRVDSFVKLLRSMERQAIREEEAKRRGLNGVDEGSLLGS